MIQPGDPRRWRRRSTGTGAAIALVFALAACGGNADAPAVATAGGPGARSTGSASAASGTIAAYVESQRLLAKCLREHGFDVPDPDSKGRLDIGAAMGGRSKTDPKILAAWEACKAFVRPVPEELEERPVWTAEQIVHRREYAKCMRANGVPDFPDPGPDGNWPGDGQQPQTEQQAAASFRAGQICEPVLDGRPPTTPNPNATGLG